jgi:protein phosphatase
LQNDLSRIASEALQISPDDFRNQVVETAELLSEEKGHVGNLDITGRLIRMNAAGEALVIGDLHGDLESLVQILQESSILSRMSESNDAVLVFLGDYGDRGGYSPEIYHVVCRLKLLYARQVVLMRGNHEGPADLMPSPHDLPTQLQSRFGRKSVKAYAEVRELWEHLYNALIVEGRCLMVHGGLPREAARAEDLANANLSHPRESFLEEILWSDPDDTVEKTYPSPRGAGRLFGKKVTNQILKKLGVKILIRGHEPCEEGFRISHDGMVLTLFSRKGPPYFNTCGAYLDFKLSKNVENAGQLIPYVHKF